MFVLTLQIFFQGLERLAIIDPGGSGGAPQGLADLLVIETLLQLQGDHRPLLGGQFFQGLVKPLAVLLGHQIFFR